jgi:hypothetical protein
MSAARQFKCHAQRGIQRQIERFDWIDNEQVLEMVHDDTPREMT